MILTAIVEIIPKFNKRLRFNKENNSFHVIDFNHIHKNLVKMTINSFLLIWIVKCPIYLIFLKRN